MAAIAKAAAWMIAISLVLGLIVGGCAIFAFSPRTEQVPGPSRVVEQTRIVEATREVTKVVYREVTVTPEATKSAPASTATTPPAPTATPTPAPVQAKVEAVPCEQLPATYSKPPQPQVGHPSFYIETGIPNTRCWVVTINDGFTAVVGGFNVNEKTNGVYTAILGPRTVTLTVENGFIAIPVNAVARDEFCFRLGQAVQYKWAHDNVYPLANWANCSFTGSTSATTAVTTTVTASTANVRTPTGKGDKTLPFPAGASVAGFLVKLDDGRSCNQCFVKKAPVSGTVTDGVIWPWPEETVGLAEPNW